MIKRVPDKFEMTLNGSMREGMIDYLGLINGLDFCGQAKWAEKLARKMINFRENTYYDRQTIITLMALLYTANFGDADRTQAFRDQGHGDWLWYMYGALAEAVDIELV
jgi:hypothetical protein